MVTLPSLELGTAGTIAETLLRVRHSGLSCGFGVAGGPHCSLTNLRLTTWLIVGPTNAPLIAFPLAESALRSSGWTPGCFEYRSGIPPRRPPTSPPRRALLYQIQIQEQVTQSLQRLLDIAVRQQVLDAIELLGCLPAALGHRPLPKRRTRRAAASVTAKHVGIHHSWFSVASTQVQVDRITARLRSHPR